MPEDPLANLRARLRDPRPFLEAAAELLAGRAQRAFREQGRGGNQWAARSVPNRMGVLADLAAGRTPPERRWDARPAGIDTGRLVASIKGRVEGRKVIVGSRLDYADQVQQGGARTIQITADVRRALAAWLRKLSGRAKRAKRESYPAHEARYQEARAAFGPLFRHSALTVDVPPRPFLGITDQDRRDLGTLLEQYLRGGA